MTEAKRIMTMDDFEHRLLVGCINKARTEYMEEGKPTEDINELLIKAIEAPRRRGRHSLFSPENGQKTTRSVTAPLPTKSDDFTGAPKVKEKRKADREGR